MQTPPIFSAIKVDGERAYDLARAGEAVTLAARPVVIEHLELVAHGPQESQFEMQCEKGTYVRAVARDLARELGTRGHVIALRRTQVGPFSERDAVDLAALEAAQPREDFLLPISAGLAGWTEVRVDAGQASAIRNGNAVLLTGTRAPVMLDIAWASSAGQPVAIGRVEAGRFQPQRVFV
jgi:tRNA pseudouridine55 synthase